MAYAYLNGRNYTTYQLQHDGIVSCLLQAGWVQHDQVLGQYTVLKSNGSAADDMYSYIHIHMTTGALNYYTAWNAVSHTGTLGMALTVLTVGLTRALYFYANANGFMAFTANSGTYSEMTGFLRVLPTETEAKVKTTLTTALNVATTTTNVVINVADGSQFQVGATYNIWDPTTAKRGTFRVASKNGNALTAVNLYTGSVFPVGSYVGCNFYNVIWRSAGYWYTNLVTDIWSGCTTALSSGTNINGYGYVIQFGRLAQANVSGGGANAVNQPDIVDTTNFMGCVLGNRRLLPVEVFDCNCIPPTIFPQIWGPPSSVGSVNQNMIDKLGITDLFTYSHSLVSTQFSGSYPIQQAGNLDTQCMTLRDTGNTTGSNMIRTLNNTTKNWVPNEHAGRVLVINSGLASGQTSKIVSNTETTLTLQDDWYTIPIAEGYIIVDNLYRVVSLAANSNMYFAECV
jgi:hypothetical protein